MGVKPIIFNSDMVRAILAGRKTVTRRVMKPQPPENTPRNYLFIPPYRTGDILYVRETWTMWDGKYEYKADVEDGYGPFCSSCTLDICAGDCNSALKWRPSIHMPKEAARLFLRVTDVRVERLQDIDADGCILEGVPWQEVIPSVAAMPDNPAYDMDAIIAEQQDRQEWELICGSYGKLWNSTIKKSDLAIYGWETNPLVWVIEFERISKEEATHEPRSKE